ncbi:MAG: hypothetical protein WAS55_08460 [Saprospiraceae bacterium]
MIDFLKLDITYLGRDHLEQSGLVFAKPGKLDLATGEFLPDKRIRAELTAIYKNLLFEIFKGGTITLSGSLHRYWNDGIHNYNNFNFAALKDPINDICQRFGIDPIRSIIHHLEFGINLYDLSYQATQIVQNLMIHSGRGNPPEHFKYRSHNTPSEFKCIVRDWYTLKIYDKGKHYQQDQEIFRLECKATKMHSLNEMGIYTLADLTKPETMDKLSGMLRFLWSGVLINDWTIREEELSQDLKYQLKDWRNPTYWTNLKAATKTKNRNKFNKELNEYSNLVQGHSDNIHKIINDSLVRNWCKNTTEVIEIHKPSKVQEHPLVIDVLAPSSVKLCLKTLIDISEQKGESKYLRESTLKKIHEKDRKLYEYLKIKFGPKRKMIQTLDDEFEAIAKNIRNKDSNPRKAIRDRVLKYGDSLFPFKTDVPLYGQSRG